MKKSTKIILIIVLVLILLPGIVYSLLRITGRPSDPSEILSYETDNPFITGETEKIAHRFGAGIAPEETLLAMETCLENPAISVDIFEFDLRMTADDQLVVIHDLKLNEISDAEEVFGDKDLTVRDLTLEELRKLNMGAKFTDSDGNRLYETSPSESLQILSLPEALDHLCQAGARRMSIEIKDKGALGMAGVDLLYKELTQRNLLDTVVFSSFQTDVSAYAAKNYPDLIRSNTDAEAVEFYLAAMTGDKDYTPPCSVVQFPYTKKYRIMGINFASAKVLNYAHSHNIAVHYWGANDENTMRYLKSLGADGVMTDYPDLMTQVYGE